MEAAARRVALVRHKLAHWEAAVARAFTEDPLKLRPARLRAERVSQHVNAQHFHKASRDVAARRETASAGKHVRLTKKQGDDAVSALLKSVARAGVSGAMAALADEERGLAGRCCVLLLQLEAWLDIAGGNVFLALPSLPLHMLHPLHAAAAAASAAGSGNAAAALTLTAAAAAGAGAPLPHAAAASAAAGVAGAVTAAGGAVAADGAAWWADIADEALRVVRLRFPNFCGDLLQQHPPPGSAVGSALDATALVARIEGDLDLLLDNLSWTCAVDRRLLSYASSLTRLADVCCSVRVRRAVTSEREAFVAAAEQAAEAVRAAVVRLLSGYSAFLQWNPPTFAVIASRYECVCAANRVPPLAVAVPHSLTADAVAAAMKLIFAQFAAQVPESLSLLVTPIAPDPTLGMAARGDKLRADADGGAGGAGGGGNRSGGGGARGTARQRRGSRAATLTSDDDADGGATAAAATTALSTTQSRDMRVAALWSRLQEAEARAWARRFRRSGAAGRYASVRVLQRAWRNFLACRAAVRHCARLATARAQHRAAGVLGRWWRWWRHERRVRDVRRVEAALRRKQLHAELVAGHWVLPDLTSQSSHVVSSPTTEDDDTSMPSPVGTPARVNNSVAAAAAAAAPTPGAVGVSVTSAAGSSMSSAVPAATFVSASPAQRHRRDAILDGCARRVQRFMRWAAHRKRRQQQREQQQQQAQQQHSATVSAASGSAAQGRKRASSVTSAASSSTSSSVLERFRRIRREQRMLGESYRWRGAARSDVVNISSAVTSVAATDEDAVVGAAATISRASSVASYSDDAAFAATDAVTRVAVMAGARTDSRGGGDGDDDVSLQRQESRSHATDLRSRHLAAHLAHLPRVFDIADDGSLRRAADADERAHATAAGAAISGQPQQQPPIGGATAAERRFVDDVMLLETHRSDAIALTAMREQASRFVLSAAATFLTAKSKVSLPLGFVPMRERPAWVEFDLRRATALPTPAVSGGGAAVATQRADGAAATSDQATPPRAGSTAFLPASDDDSCLIMSGDVGGAAGVMSPPALVTRGDRPRNAQRQTDAAAAAAPAGAVGRGESRRTLARGASNAAGALPRGASRSSLSAPPAAAAAGATTAPPPAAAPSAAAAAATTPQRRQEEAAATTAAPSPLLSVSRRPTFMPVAPVLCVRVARSELRRPFQVWSNAAQCLRAIVRRGLLRLVAVLRRSDLSALFQFDDANGGGGGGDDHHDAAGRRAPPAAPTTAAVASDSAAAFAMARRRAQALDGTLKLLCECAGLVPGAASTAAAAAAAAPVASTTEGDGGADAGNANRAVPAAGAAGAMRPASPPPPGQSASASLNDAIAVLSSDIGRLVSDETLPIVSILRSALDLESRRLVVPWVIVCGAAAEFADLDPATVRRNAQQVRRRALAVAKAQRREARRKRRVQVEAEQAMADAARRRRTAERAARRDAAVADFREVRVAQMAERDRRRADRVRERAAAKEERRRRQRDEAANTASASAPPASRPPSASAPAAAAGAVGAKRPPRVPSAGAVRSAASLDASKPASAAPAAAAPPPPRSPSISSVSSVESTPRTPSFSSLLASDSDDDHNDGGRAGVGADARSKAAPPVDLSSSSSSSSAGDLSDSNDAPDDDAEAFDETNLAGEYDDDDDYGDDEEEQDDASDASSDGGGDGGVSRQLRRLQRATARARHRARKLALRHLEARLTAESDDLAALLGAGLDADAATGTSASAAVAGRSGAEERASLRHGDAVRQRALAFADAARASADIDALVQLVQCPNSLIARWLRLPAALCADPSRIAARVDLLLLAALLLPFLRSLQRWFDANFVFEEVGAAAAGGGGGGGGVGGAPSTITAAAAAAASAAMGMAGTAYDDEDDDDDQAGARGHGDRGYRGGGDGDDDDDGAAFYGENSDDGDDGGGAMPPPGANGSQRDSTGRGAMGDPRLRDSDSAATGSGRGRSSRGGSGGASVANERDGSGARSPSPNAIELRSPSMRPPTRVGRREEERSRQRD
jgi:hypothetical protein